jgi:hypothetical protein
MSTCYTPAPEAAMQRKDQFLYLTTTGRKTRLPREIEIWFVEGDGGV